MLLAENVIAQAQAFSQRVLDVIGKHRIERIGLKAGEPGHANEFALDSGEVDDSLYEAKEANVDPRLARDRGGA